jgi:hypothetical protein
MQRTAKQPSGSVPEVLIGARPTERALSIYPEPHDTTVTSFSLVESYLSCDIAVVVCYSSLDLEWRIGWARNCKGNAN